MVNFRFHVVSIVAVFLALALGIGMGVTVIDKATVDFLKKRLDTVSNDVSVADRRSNDLQRQIGRDSAYEGLAADYVLDGKMTGVPVALMSFRGVDPAPLNDLRKDLAQSGATVLGTVWFPAKDSLGDARDAATLQQLLGAASSDATQLRQTLVTRVSAVMAGSDGGGALKPLVDAGFLEWEADKGSGDIDKLQFSTARLVVASGIATSVPNEQLALPLTRLLASQPVKRMVVAEPGRDPDEKTSGERAVFLQTLRSDASLNGKISTVDNIEMPAGQVATVLALAQLPAGRTGNYGVASSAQSLIPKLNP